MNNKPKPNKVTVEAFHFEKRSYTLPQGYEYFGHGVIKEKGTRIMVYIMAINREQGIKRLLAFNAEEHYPLTRSKLRERRMIS